MEARSGFKFGDCQKAELSKALRDGKFEKLTPAENFKHGRPFKNKAFKNKLISEWEAKTGQVWPSQMRKIKGEMKKTRVDAHHIIPQEMGGPHEWWNMKPLAFGSEHQGGVHAKGSP